MRYLNALQLKPYFKLTNRNGNLIFFYNTNTALPPLYPALPPPPFPDRTTLYHNNWSQIVFNYVLYVYRNSNTLAGTWRSFDVESTLLQHPYVELALIRCRLGNVWAGSSILNSYYCVINFLIQEMFTMFCTICVKMYLYMYALGPVGLMLYKEMYLS